MKETTVKYTCTGCCRIFLILVSFKRGIKPTKNFKRRIFLINVTISDSRAPFELFAALIYVQEEGTEGKKKSCLQK